MSLGLQCDAGDVHSAKPVAERAADTKPHIRMGRTPRIGLAEHTLSGSLH